ncbi:MAG: SIS domain-containing protein [Acidobacteria bacterium]|nr:SIS domain-containing protein [Acidobacteriota bacterium]
MNRPESITRIDRELAESCRVKQSFPPLLKRQMADLADRMARALKAGRTIYWLGNGGSATDAMHLAAELVGKLSRPRRALASVALSANPATLTAIGNDFGFEEVFSRQVEALVRRGDVVIGISTSGNSMNVIRAMRAARKLKATTVGFTGQRGGKLARAAELVLKVPSRDTQRIQESHITIGHIVCGLAEDILLDRL